MSKDCEKNAIANALGISEERSDYLEYVAKEILIKNDDSDKKSDVIKSISDSKISDRLEIIFLSYMIGGFIESMTSRAPDLDIVRKLLSQFN